MNSMLALKKLYNSIVPEKKVKASFSIASIIYALLLFDMYGKLGRIKLEERLGISRGSLSTLIGRLKGKLGMIEAEKYKAHHLTMKGKEVVRKIKSEFTMIGHIPSIFEDFMLGEAYNAIGRVTCSGIDVEDIKAINPLKLISAAQDAGGEKLISLVSVAGNNLEVLSADIDLRRTYGEEWVKINEFFPLNEGDVVLISASNSELDAKIALIAASLEVHEYFHSISKENEKDVNQGEVRDPPV
ncbi:MAG: hypothetical protein ACTSU9_16595 [Promethearchaeota archaeon]